MWIFLLPPVIAGIVNVVLLCTALQSIAEKGVTVEKSKAEGNLFSDIQELELAIKQQRKVARARKDHESNALLQRLLETRENLIREQRGRIFLAYSQGELRTCDGSSDREAS